MRTPQRRVRDPRKLAKATRVVKTAVALRTLTLDDLIRETVDQMPPLTATQRADLAALLRGAESSTADRDTDPL